MAADESSPPSPEPPDYTAVTILGVLCLLEIAILYVLIAVETPLAPVVRRLLRNPPGVFTLVMFVVCLLCMGMWAFLSFAERLHKRRAASGSA